MGNCAHQLEKEPLRNALGHGRALRYHCIGFINIRLRRRHRRPVFHSQMRKVQPSTYDVARLANVSVSTVSRVINGQKGVHAATRSAVWAAIREIGYEVIRDESTLSGVLILSPSLRFDSPYLQQVMSGIFDEASRSPVPVMVSFVSTREAALAEVQAFSDRNGVLGVILACFPTHLAAADWLLDDPNIATVSVLMNSAASMVNVDGYNAVRRATLKLLLLGHCRIAIAIHSLAWWTQQRRLQGFLDAFKQVGLKAPDVSGYLPVTNAEVREWLDAQLRKKEPPTAIIGGTSDLSNQIFAELHRRRISIPGDLSFIGIGHARRWDEPLFDIVRQPTFDLGIEAVRALRKIVAHPGRRIVLDLPAPLVHTGSLGPPKSHE